MADQSPQPFGGYSGDEYDDADFFNRPSVLHWREVLRELVGWSDARFERWAMQFKGYVMNPSSWFASLESLSFPANLLIPDRFRLEEEGDMVWRKIVFTLRGEVVPYTPERHWGPFYENWPHVRDLIDSRLREIGSSLEEVTAELAEKDETNIPLGIFRKI